MFDILVLWLTGPLLTNEKRNQRLNIVTLY